MQKQTKNTILFVVLMVLCFFIWLGVKTWFAPPPPPPPVPEEVKQAAAALGASDGGLGQGLAQAALLAQAGAPATLPEAKPQEKPAPPPVAAEEKYKPTPVGDLKTSWSLGENDRASKFHLYAVLDPHGAGVRILVLNKFQQADPWGRPMTLPDGSPKPMELIPDDPDNPSFLLLAYEVNNKDADRPLDTLGRVNWASDGVKTATLPDGRERQSVTFTSPPLKELQGLRVTKTFSVTQGDYHLGLEVKVEGDDKASFRYQLTGAHGLPIEGRWYTYIFRNCADRPGGREQARLLLPRRVPRLPGRAPDLQRRGRQRGGAPAGLPHPLRRRRRAVLRLRHRGGQQAGRRQDRPERPVLHRPRPADAGNHPRQGRRPERGRGRQELRPRPRGRQTGTDFLHPRTGFLRRRAAAAGRGRSQIQGRRPDSPDRPAGPQGQARGRPLLRRQLSEAVGRPRPVVRAAAAQRRPDAGAVGGRRRRCASARSRPT